MTDQEPSSFRVVDRRSGAQPVEGPTSTESDSKPLPDAGDISSSDSHNTSPDDEKEIVEPSASSMPDPTALLNYVAMQMDARDLAAGLIGIFATHAWRAMGLVPHPVTGEIATDLPEAQLAIDAVHFLLGKVEKDLPEMERRELQRRLNDLRMNFLERARK